MRHPVPSSGSCRRCSQPLEAQSESGLCPTCQLAADTSLSSAERITPNPFDGAETVSAPPGDSATQTGSNSPADPNTDRVRASDDTAEPEARSQLPPAPPGYDLFRRLGGGGMGEVYLAREHAAERVVAMKFLRGGPAGVDRFLVEVRALAALDHPNIVRVLSTDFYRADPYFTMEYAPGGSLAKYVEDHGPLAPADAARLIVTVARAVEEAHKKDLIHRDLKPSNILLHGANGQGRGASQDHPAGPSLAPCPSPLAALTPKVSDFGLAKRLDCNDAVTVGTGPLGTPGYMPPEQISKKNGEVGPVSDVYGLGASLYHLVTGRPPFVGDTREQIITSVLSDPPPRPRAIRAELPPELEGIVVKCLEKDQKDRYPSAAALADDLERFLAGQKPVAPPLTPLRRAARWVGRHRWRVAAAAALVLGLAATAIALIPPREPPDRYRRELAAGRPVTLIGETGLPRWYQWPFGPTALGESITGDRACAFESIQDALLVLLDDPGIDRYRVTADLRILRSARARPDAPNPPPVREAPGTNLVGLFVGHSMPIATDGLPAHAFMALTYNDYLSPEVKAAGITQAAVQCRTGFIPVRPDVSPESSTASCGPPIRFTPAKGLPGEWRRLRVEVTPEGIRPFWAEKPEGPLAPLAAVTPDVIAERTEMMRKHFAEAHPGVDLPVFRWSPRMPIGIWCRGSAVAVRNVVIEPLPRPPL